MELDIYTLQTEKDLQHKLEMLFDEWKSSIVSNDNTAPVKYFVEDGFYPYYTNQKIKILFVGRECLGLNGENFIDVMYPAYKEYKQIGKIPLNRANTHNRMFYITYGLLHQPECKCYHDMPRASEIADDFATNKGVSFAFMNLSKFSNESGGWKSDWNLINRFVLASKNEKCNFYNKEIELLDPDVIITMNFGAEKIEVLGEYSDYLYGEDVSSYNLKVGDDKEIPLFDMWHFAAVRKNFDKSYYSPLIDRIKQLRLSFNV